MEFVDPGRPRDYGKEEKAYRVFAGQIVVVGPDGTTETCEASKPGGLGIVLALLRESLVGLAVDPGGALRMRFANGWAFVIDALALYEAWEVWSPSGMRYISLPGGGVDAFEVRRTD